MSAARPGNGVLAARSITGTRLWASAVAASAPMTVLAGGITATYASTGVTGVPLSFIAITAALALLTVGYTTLARHLPNTAPLHAQLAHLGRPIGVAGAAVALLGYNAIQIGLYGLLGVTIHGVTHVGPWWLWAGLTWLVVAMLGQRRVAVSSRVLLIALACEITLIVIFDAITLHHQPLDIGPLLPQALLRSGSLAPGSGGVFAFGIAAMVGYETATAYAEEARVGHTVVPVVCDWVAATPRERLPGRATTVALLCCGGLYTVSSWALIEAAGPGRASSVSAETIYGMLRHVPGAGPVLPALAQLTLIYSVVGAMVSFHSTVARYLFALGRERVIVAALAETDEHGTPRRASIVQSGIAAIVIVAVAVDRVDPITGLFTVASAIGALAILALLVMSSLATLAHCARIQAVGRSATIWEAIVGPLLAMAAGGGVLIVIISNLDALGVSGSKTLWVPASIAGAALAGCLYAAALRVARPQVYAGIGRGLPDPLRVLPPWIRAIEV